MPIPALHPFAVGGNRGSNCCTRSTSYAPVLLLLTAIALLGTVSTAQYAAWLNGPADAWGAVLNNAGASTEALRMTMATDFRQAIISASGNPGLQPVVTVTLLSAQTSTSPAIGLMADYTATDAGGMTAQEVEAAVMASPLINVNSAVGAAFGGGTLRVLSSAGPESTKAVESAEIIGISGSAFIWNTVQMVVGSPLPAAMQAPLAFDFQNAVDPAQSSYLFDMVGEVMNTSGYYVRYAIYRMPNAVVSVSKAQLTERVADAELPLYTKHILGTIMADPGTAEYSDIMPNPITPTTHLYPNPNAPENPVLPILREVTSEVRMLFSGTKQGWSNAMNSQNSQLRTRLAAHVLSAVKQGTSQDKAEVGSITYEFSEEKKVANMVAVVQVIQGEVATSTRTYTDMEVASVVAHYDDYGSVFALYDSNASTGTPGWMDPDIPTLIATGLSASYGLQCTSACVAAIAVASVAAFLTVFTVVVGAIVACCCCCCFGKDGTAAARGPAKGTGLDGAHEDHCNGDEGYGGGMEGGNTHQRDNLDDDTEGVHVRRTAMPDPGGFEEGGCSEGPRPAPGGVPNPLAAACPAPGTRAVLVDPALGDIVTESDEVTDFRHTSDGIMNRASSPSWVDWGKGHTACDTWKVRGIGSGSIEAEIAPMKGTAASPIKDVDGVLSNTNSPLPVYRVGQGYQSQIGYVV